MFGVVSSILHTDMLSEVSNLQTHIKLGYNLVNHVVSEEIFS